jgi:quercetin dioxygenase-like cupin family protein
MAPEKGEPTAMTDTIMLTPSRNMSTLWVVRDRVRFGGHLHHTPFVILEVQVPPGAGTPLHQHASPELFRVLSGEITFTTLKDGIEHRMIGRAGDVLSVPSNEPHGYINASDAAAEMLVILDRTMWAFFGEIGSEAPGFGPPTQEELARIWAACAKYGISFVETTSPV